MRGLLRAASLGAGPPHAGHSDGQLSGCVERALRAVLGGRGQLPSTLAVRPRGRPPWSSPEVR
eukprot:11303496-Alexandrium_andersonii.AAC.1